jgi:hypothetical protein
MKKADITAGAEYAVEVGWNGEVVKAKVLEVGIARRGSSKLDGAEVETLEEFREFSRTKPAGTRMVVATGRVRRPWTATDTLKRSNAAAADQNRAELAARLDAAGIVPVTPSSDWRRIWEGGPRDIVVPLRLDDVHALLDRALEAQDDAPDDVPGGFPDDVAGA